MEFRTTKEVEEDRMTFEGLGEKSPDEKRQWPKIDKEGCCFVDGSEVAYQIKNIGPGGIRISSPEEIEPGTKSRLHISLKDGHQFESSGYVIWCSENGEGSPNMYEVGFKFVDLHPEDIRHIKKLLVLKY